MFNILELNDEELLEKTGMTREELDVIEPLVKSWNALIELDVNDVTREHAQKSYDAIIFIIMHRIMGRNYPEFWNMP